MSPRRNWDSPTPSLASECAPPAGTKGWDWRGTLACGWGVGGVPTPPVPTTHSVPYSISVCDIHRIFWSGRRWRARPPARGWQATQTTCTSTTTRWGRTARPSAPWWTGRSPTVRSAWRRTGCGTWRGWRRAWRGCVWGTGGGSSYRPASAGPASTTPSRWEVVFIFMFYSGAKLT